jgi:hypothetical protein
MWDIIMLEYVPTKVTLSFFLRASLMVSSVVVGIDTGNHCFGIMGAIAGGILGCVIGFFVSAFPECLSMLFFFREIQKSTNEELRARISLGDWEFGHTLALRQLTDRWQDIREELLRIIGMLESANQLTRMDGWNALWLGTEEYKLIEDYNPHDSTLECRAKITKLKSALNNMNKSNPVNPA